MFIGLLLSISLHSVLYYFQIRHLYTSLCEHPNKSGSPMTLYVVITILITVLYMPVNVSFKVYFVLLFANFFSIFTVKNITKIWMYGLSILLSIHWTLSYFPFLYWHDRGNGNTHGYMPMIVYRGKPNFKLNSLHRPLQHLLPPEHFIVSNFVLITVLLHLEVLISWYTKNDIVFVSNIVLLYFSSVTIPSYNHCILR